MYSIAKLILMQKKDSCMVDDVIREKYLQSFVTSLHEYNVTHLH